MATSTDTTELFRLDQEIRFAKTEQLAIMTASMTLLGALLGFGRLLIPLQPWEKGLGVAAACAVAVGGILFIWSLQTHLQTTRAKINSGDDSAGIRGLWISIAYTFVLALGAAMIVYAFITR
jgi:protein-S-isoprenylcysteine O-methyltransferase Ste14